MAAGRPSWLDLHREPGIGALESARGRCTKLGAARAESLKAPAAERLVVAWARPNDAACDVLPKRVSKYCLQIQGVGICEISGKPSSGKAILKISEFVREETKNTDIL